MEIYKIETGVFNCDGGAMFGVVPKRVWQKRYPCNDDNFCKMSMRCMLIKTDEKLILIDTGTGTKQLEYLKYYAFDEIVDFESELNKLGYSCAEVTDVIQTHLHFDHCGGGTYYADKEKKDIRLTFPNAYFWVGKAQWENFMNPNVREGDSFFPENMLPIEQAGKLKLITENFVLCPEVEMRVFNGHTVGQIVPYVHYNEQTFVFVGDVIPMVASIPIAWVSAYDTHPIVSMEEKEILLQEAEEKKQILFFEHDYYNECCTIKKVNNRYRVNMALKLSDIF